MANIRRVISIGVVALLVLALVAFNLFFISRSPFGKANSSFAAEKDKPITRIEMSNGESEVVLRLSDNGWSVNDIEGASKNKINSLLGLLTEIQIKSPVSETVFEETIVKKDIPVIKVKAFADLRVATSFLVYPTESNVYGNIMKTGDKSKPFIVFAPGYETNIGSYFNTDEKFWLPYTVFILRPSEIKTIDVSYKDDTASSFKIDRSSGKNVLAGADTGTDSLKIIRYLSYFNYIPFEEWASTLSEDEKSRIVTTTPAIKISVTTKAGKDYTLSIWDRMKSENGIPVKDTDRVWGRLNDNNELFVMRYFDIDPILKKRQYFIK